MTDIFSDEPCLIPLMIKRIKQKAQLLQSVLQRIIHVELF